MPKKNFEKIIDNLAAGNYTVEVVAIAESSRTISAKATLPIVIAAPQVPDGLTYSPGNFDLVLTPTINGNSGVLLCELKGSDDTTESNAVLLGRGYNFTDNNLAPLTNRYYWARSVNGAGESAWSVMFTATTLNDGSVIADLLTDLDSGNFSSEVADLLAQVDEVTQDSGRLSDVIEFNANAIAFEARQRENMERTVFDVVAEQSSFRQGYEERVLLSERMIDAAVVVDPDTGLITNRAFAYSDNKFSEAQVIIDGVNARIDLEAKRLTSEADKITQAQASISVQAGQILQRATYSELHSEVAGAIAALTPAYSWQFNSTVEGFTGGTWQADGSIVLTQGASIVTPTIALDATTDFVFRLRVKKHVGATWTGLISFAGGSITLPEPQNEDTWEVLTVNASGANGFTGTVTSLTFNLGACDVDSIEIGKRGANDLALADISLRTSSIETDINAGTGSMANYATTLWVNELGYQTQSNVDSIIDSFNTTYQISATLAEFNENNTLAKANSAQLWVEGADATIRSNIIAYNAEDGGVEDKLTAIATEASAQKGEIASQIISVNNLALDNETLGVAALLAEYNQFLLTQDVKAAEVSLAYADNKLTVQANELEAQASEQLTLIAKVANSESSISQLNKASANSTSALALSEKKLRVEIGEGEEKAVAAAKEYTKTAVGYCVDENGNTTSHNDAVLCVAAGHSWVDGALAEFIRNLRINKDGKSASISDIRQVFDDDDGKLVVRGGMLTRNDGKVVGFATHNDGSQGTFDIITDNFNIGTEIAGIYHSVLAIDALNKKANGEADPVMTLRARLQLEDTTIEKLADIKAADGVATSHELLYSVDGVNDWHFPMVDGDIYQKQRTKSQKGEQSPSYSQWSEPATIKGDKGDEGGKGDKGDKPVNGVDYSIPAAIPGPQGARGAGRYTVDTYNGAWSNTTANNATPNNAPVIDDVVTIYKTSDPKVQTTKYVSSVSSSGVAVWSSFKQHIVGSLLVDESIHADKLIAKTLKVNHIDGEYVTRKFIQTTYAKWLYNKSTKVLLSFYVPKVAWARTVSTDAVYITNINPSGTTYVGRLQFSYDGVSWSTGPSTSSLFTNKDVITPLSMSLPANVSIHFRLIAEPITNTSGIIYTQGVGVSVTKYVSGIIVT